MHLLNPISRLLLVLLLGVMSLGASAQYTYFNKSHFFSEDSTPLLITGIEAIGGGNYIGGGVCCAWNQAFLTFDEDGEIIANSELSQQFSGTALPAWGESISAAGDGTILCVTSISMGNSETVAMRLEMPSMELINSSIVTSETENATSYWSIIELASGDVILGGSDEINNDEDALIDEAHLIITKMENDLTSYVTSQFNFFPGEFCYPREIFEMSDGRLCVFGHTYLGPVHDIWVAIFTSDLLEVDFLYRWEGAETNGAISVVEVGQDVYQIATSHVLEFSEDHTLKMIRFDAMAEQEVWSVSLNPEPTYYILRDIERTVDGGFVILGNYVIDGINEEGGYSWLLKTDSIGNEEWLKSYFHVENPGGATTQYLNDLEIDQDGGYMCSGEYLRIDGFEYEQKLWLLKLDACGDEEWQGCEPIVGVEEVMVGDVNAQALHTWPNPVSESTLNYSTGAYLSVGSVVELVDVNGKVILSKSTSLPEINGSIEVGQLDAGLYVLRVAGEQKRVLIE